MEDVSHRKTMPLATGKKACIGNMDPSLHKWVTPAMVEISTYHLFNSKNDNVPIGL